MLVIVLERVPTRLRGELTRWLLEVRAGVFVGRVSAMVRERLWEHVAAGRGRGAAVLVHASSDEQGFQCQVLGDPGYHVVVDLDGLQLIRRPMVATKPATADNSEPRLPL